MAKLRWNQRYGVSINNGRTYVSYHATKKVARRVYKEMCWRGLSIGACIIDRKTREDIT